MRERRARYRVHPVSAHRRRWKPLVGSQDSSAGFTRVASPITLLKTAYLADGSSHCSRTGRSPLDWGQGRCLSRLQLRQIHDIYDPGRAPHASVVALHGDSQGNSGIGTKGGGLGRFKMGVFVSFARKTSSLPVNVYRILEQKVTLDVLRYRHLPRPQSRSGEGGQWAEVALTVAFGRADGMAEHILQRRSTSAGRLEDTRWQTLVPDHSGLVVIAPTASSLAKDRLGPGGKRSCRRRPN